MDSLEERYPDGVGLPDGHVCDAETAGAEFDRWADGMDLDFDTSKMDAEDLTAFEKQKGKITLAIQKGHLIVNDDDEIVYTPWRKKSKYKDPITFHERTCASLLATDGKKKNQDAKKTYAMMADMTGLTPNVFAGLSGTDAKICEAVFALLMD